MKKMIGNLLFISIEIYFCFVFSRYIFKGWKKINKEEKKSLIKIAIISAILILSLILKYF